MRKLHRPSPRPGGFIELDPLVDDETLIELRDILIELEDHRRLTDAEFQMLVAIDKRLEHDRMVEERRRKNRVANKEQVRHTENQIAAMKRGHTTRFRTLN